MANIDNFDKTSLAALWGNKIKPGLGGKIDKVPSATSGHLAKFDDSGQVVDGGDKVKQELGGSANDVMSQAAVTREFEGIIQKINDEKAYTLDLSYYDPVARQITLRQNTANCYPLGSGTYKKFPLVYGNGIKNGLPNPAAYTRQGSDYTADFVNHLGNPIVSPYIEEHPGCQVASVEVLWQTNWITYNTPHSGIIKSVEIIDGPNCRYVKIIPGVVSVYGDMACIAVKDANGDIIWSWIIWSPPVGLSYEKITNYTGVEYEMMNIPLCCIKDADTQYRCALYQWGRKDIIGLPSAYNSTTPSTLYDASGNTVTIDTYGVADDADIGGTVRSVANAIKMPNKFFLEYDNTKYNWNNLPWFNNFWNAAETASSELADNQLTAIKTIYDPCPVGFMIPGPRAWTGFTSTGTNSSTSSEFKVIPPFSNGWKFKKNASDTEGTFYPASGYRNRTSGALDSVGSYGYFWSFAHYSQANARNLGFSSGSVYPLNIYYRAHGFAVRPSREY